MANAISYQINDGFGAPKFLARIRGAIADYRLYRTTLGELESLNDRELADLGLSRFSIHQVAYDSVYGD